MMEKLKIAVSNIRFTEQEEEPMVQIHFNTMGGQININGHVVVTQADFFTNSGSTEAMTEMVRVELTELLTPMPS
ncbi:hypothetical protein B481_1987 [Planococcus halocryophilus Or1]|uniref:Uncharacterized protein n=1 Tax=Planococcus halocryophilus TaxID=1215089 RepID=A0A1C7DPW7_9BACL|nr:hypothetical protein [Planococcus halocryophilus]ANU13457.1 hypothetical protein BBI08_06205 [Planococcus halocryophilus]EMF46260.1 hypothetical protein B481_1987 [Planococcus halocryophilus Or1]